MKAEKILLPIAAIAVIYLLMAKKAVGTLQYFVNKIGFDFSGITPIVNLQVGVQNPSNESFQIKSFVGSLTVSGVYVGQVSSFAVVDVPAASQVFYPLQIRVGLIGIISDVSEFLQKGGESKSVEFTGFVNASGVVLPINLKYSL